MNNNLKVMNATSYSLEKNLYRPSVFIDIFQNYDRSQHECFLYKLKKCLHSIYFLIKKSYLSDHHFLVYISDIFFLIVNICLQSNFFYITFTICPTKYTQHIDRQLCGWQGNFIYLLGSYLRHPNPISAS